MGLFFGMVLTIRTKEGMIQQKYRTNLHTPADNAKIDIMSILMQYKK